MNQKKELLANKNRYRTIPLLGIAFFIVFIATFLEALFQLSKISFLSRLNIWEIASVIVNSLTMLLLPIIIMFGIVKFLFWIFRPYPKICYFIKSSILFFCSLIFVSVMFTHIDTWLYTTFKFNVADLPQLLNKVLLLVVVIISIIVLIRLGDKVYLRFAAHSVLIIGTCIFLLGFWSIYTTHSIIKKFPHLKNTMISKSDRKKLPNIILFSSDGIDSRHMSIYGYKRKTTPNIDKLGEKSFIYTKAFTNTGNSRGSVVSILTGKHPLTTKVLYPPDILLYENAFQHLPGILADMGYYCVDIGDGLFVSPRKSNMQLAFHSENGVNAKFSDNIQMVRIGRIFGMELYFLSEIGQRIYDRLGYIAGFSKKLLHYKTMVKGVETTSFADTKRIEEVITKIREIDKPIFAHIHLMKTHGPKFHNFVKQKFSVGKVQDKAMDLDFYDDAVLSIDCFFGMIIETLKETGKFENSLIIIHTDHDMNRCADIAVPLIVHLPSQEEKRIVDDPVQYIDIAPSILSYLKLQIPDWMEGIPIFPDIDTETLNKRPVYIVSARAYFDKKEKKWLKKSIGPPLHGIVGAAILKEDMLYVLYLDSGVSIMYNVSINPTKPQRIDNKDKHEYKELLLSYLQSKGIDTSVIKFR